MRERERERERKGDEHFVAAERVSSYGDIMILTTLIYLLSDSKTVLCLCVNTVDFIPMSGKTRALI